jgi:hypothetical protein
MVTDTSTTLKVRALRTEALRAPALPAQPIPGGGSEGGQSPPPSRLAALRNAFGGHAVRKVD